MQVITLPTEQSEQAAVNFQKKVISHGTLSLYPVAQGIVDIFQGDGWTTHSRYRNYKGRWFWLSGARIDAERLPNGA